MPRKHTNSTGTQTNRILDAQATHGGSTPSRNKQSTDRTRPKKVAAGTSIPEDAMLPTPPKTNRPQQLLALLGGGAPQALTQICEAFAWQPHSARAAISGLRKAGHRIDVGRTDGGATAYSLDLNGNRSDEPDAALSNPPDAAPSTGRARRKAKVVKPTDTAGPVGEPKADAAASAATETEAEIGTPAAVAGAATPA